MKITSISGKQRSSKNISQITFCHQNYILLRVFDNLTLQQPHRSPITQLTLQQHSTSLHLHIMQPNTHYINHTLNTSSFRNTARFSKASRFEHKPNTPTDYNYNVTARSTARSCSFGVGNRPINTNPIAAPTPDRYNIVDFPNDKRASSLGESKQNAVFRSFTKEMEKKAGLPSPDTYNLVENNHGKGFTLRMKLPGEIQFSVKRRVPGPGQYKPVQICPSGRYASSKTRNIRCISFGLPKREYIKRSTGLGPGSYDVFNMDSSFSERKVGLMRRNTTRNFGSSHRMSFQDKTKSCVPGPGNYQTFSRFGHRNPPTIS